MTCYVLHVAVVFYFIWYICVCVAAIDVRNYTTKSNGNSNNSNLWSARQQTGVQTAKIFNG